MTLESILNESIILKQKVLDNTELLQTINLASQSMVDAYRSGNKVLLCGNGGSAADAQHIAAELSGRFYFDRPPLFAEALHVNSSYMTAVANDYSFAEVYARLVRAFGKDGDVLVAISTSGNSENILNAAIEANKRGMITIGFTGEGGGKLKEHCKHLIAVPSNNTPRIQELHILIGHFLCETVENQLFKK